MAPRTRSKTSKVSSKKGNKKSKMPPKEPEPCYFFEKLPRELRDMIYKEYFTGNIVNVDYRIEAKDALLSADSQLRAEATEAFWTNSIFTSNDEYTLDFQFRAIPMTTRKLIKHIFLDYGFSNIYKDGELLRRKAFYNALWAQRAAIKLKAMLEESGGKDIDIQTQFQLCKGINKTAVSPWLLYASEVFKVVEEEREENGELSKETLKTEYAVKLQSRFFEFEHGDEDACWVEEWHKHAEQHKCAKGCKKKEKTEGEA